MQAIVRDKDGKKIVQFYFNFELVKHLCKKLGLTYEEYMVGLAKIKVEEKRKRKKKKNGNTRKQSKETS
jgi:hypothetical protein